MKDYRFSKIFTDFTFSQKSNTVEIIFQGEVVSNVVDVRSINQTLALIRRMIEHGQIRTYVIFGELKSDYNETYKSKLSMTRDGVIHDIDIQVGQILDIEIGRVVDIPISRPTKRTVRRNSKVQISQTIGYNKLILMDYLPVFDVRVKNKIVNIIHFNGDCNREKLLGVV